MTEVLSLTELINLERWSEFLMRLKELCINQDAQKNPEILEFIRSVRRIEYGNEFLIKNILSDIAGCTEFAIGMVTELNEAYHGKLWQKDAIAYLQGKQRAADDASRIKTVIVEGDKGRTAMLSVDRFNCVDEEPALQVFPCAENMSFVKTDTDIKDSYSLALEAAIQELNLNKEQIKANFRWSLLADDGLSEITSLEGGSLGGAFSLLFYKLLEADANIVVECEGEYV